MQRFILILLAGLLWSNIALAKEQAIDICGKVKTCIKDFKIENMSIGDSLLDFLDKKEIKKAKAKKRKYKNNKYTMMIIDGSDNFDEVWISYQTKDKKYKIAYIKGVKLMDDKQECRDEREKYKSELMSSWNMTFKKSKTDPETYLFGAPALGRNWYWGGFGCKKDGLGGLSLFIAPHTETWAKWYRTAYIPGK